MADNFVRDVTKQIFKGIELKPVGALYLALVRAFPLTRIMDVKENEAALSVMERLMTFVNEHESDLPADARRQFSQYMICLGGLIEEFEHKTYAAWSKKMSGRETLAYLMELHNLKQSDLKEELGGQSVVSGILSGDREFNIRQVRALADRFRVSPLAFFD